MPIPVSQITDKQLQEVLSYIEGHFLDLKAKEIKPSKLTKSISAFANADGGELYIGIAENTALPFPHKWDGFAKPEDANAHLQVFEKLFPLGGDYLYSFLSHPSKTGIILQAVVRKTKTIVKATTGPPIFAGEHSAYRLKPPHSTPSWNVIRASHLSRPNLYL